MTVGLPGLGRTGLRLDVGDPAPGAATVTLDQAGRRNAMTPAMWRALAAIGGALPAEVRVVVVRGAGPSFSAGLDRGMFTPEGVPGEDPLPSPAEPGRSRTGSPPSRTASPGCATRPRLGRRGPGARHRRRLPARAVLRPAGGRRRRPVLHEGAGARAGPRPHRHQAAGRDRRATPGPGDLPRPAAAWARPRRPSSGWPSWSCPARTWTRPSATWSPRCSRRTPAVARATKELLPGHGTRASRRGRAAAQAAAAAPGRAGRAAAPPRLAGCRRGAPLSQRWS